VAHRGRKNADEALLLALVCGATVENAAAAAGVSPRTATRRLADSEFQKRLQALRLDIVQRTSGALTAAGTEAVRTLLELLKAGSSAPVRLRAAQCVLEIGIKMRVVTDLEERITALEQQEAPGMGQ
jgi:AcrR family transcriptional regulator